MLEDVTIVFRGSEPEGPPEMPPLQLENFIPVLDQGQMGEAPFSPSGKPHPLAATLFGERKKSRTNIYALSCSGFTESVEDFIHYLLSLFIKNHINVIFHQKLILTDGMCVRQNIDEN